MAATCEIVKGRIINHHWRKVVINKLIFELHTIVSNITYSIDGKRCCKICDEEDKLHLIVVALVLDM